MEITPTYLLEAIIVLLLGVHTFFSLVLYIKRETNYSSDSGGGVCLCSFSGSFAVHSALVFMPSAVVAG